MCPGFTMWYREVFNFVEGYNFNNNSEAFVRSPYNLLNFGSMEQFWFSGYAGNYSQIADQLQISNFTKECYVPNQNATLWAELFWNWMIYITEEFTLHKSMGGSASEAALGAFTSQALYDAFTKVILAYC